MCDEMDLDPAWLFSSFMISLIGLGLFMYGKKQSRIPQMTVGVVLMGFPYFVSSLAVLLGVAAVLGGLLYLAVRSGL